jgi:hypothetical protein
MVKSVSKMLSLSSGCSIYTVLYFCVNLLRNLNMYNLSIMLLPYTDP